MGFSGKQKKFDGEIRETGDGKEWVIAGISIRAPLKPIRANPVTKPEEAEDEEVEFPTTPTAVSVRIPVVPTCPPPPKKRKPTLKCSYGGAREFFSPPDLETAFIQRA
ncbi:PREDICTED: uncharacterized protein LOC104809580 [Tarenaya hassleriana]|uniref:uncharacterized protein LOC104809580 n=1 Tax=Tarenaya hassleriana TaxID=28532 RepID=UPI00053C1992|nr:PREDICTED: uncharacterized protein LOC104809580 [Tarenaya hassleriana]